MIHRHMAYPSYQLKSIYVMADYGTHIIPNAETNILHREVILNWRNTLLKYRDQKSFVQINGTAVVIGMRSIKTSTPNCFVQLRRSKQRSSTVLLPYYHRQNIRDQLAAYRSSLYNWPKFSLTELTPGIVTNRIKSCNLLSLLTWIY